MRIAYIESEPGKKDCEMVLANGEEVQIRSIEWFAKRALALPVSIS
jgi:hypothetical protein